MQLVGMPLTVPGVRYFAKTNNFSAQIRSKSGGGLEYALASMPKNIQNAVRKDCIAALVLADIKPVIVKPLEIALRESTKLNALNEKQRRIADARLAVVNKVTELEAHLSRVKAVGLVIKHAKEGGLDKSLMAYIAIANAKNNTQSRVLSQRTLMQWVIDASRCKTPQERLQVLAPAIRRAAPLESLAWLPSFLMFYQKTNGVSVIEAYGSFVKACADKNIAYPSIHQVYRGLDKMNELERNAYRVTGSALKAKLPYVKRDWQVLGVNGCWIGDGTAMKLKVAHPDHGRPFIPELTMVIDGASRYIVGWSVSLAENTLAVADAIRVGVEKHGVPLIYYSDNGAGQTSKLLDADLTGIFARLNINHQTGIPGNPQGRGIIERVNKTIAQRIARQFPTYFGGKSDREATRKMLVAVNSVANAQMQNKELTQKQTANAKKYPLPSWAQFLEMCAVGVDWYNNEHIHSELLMTPLAARTAQLVGTSLDMLSINDTRDLFRPEVTRIVQRGWINLFNNDYFSLELANFDGKTVRVSFDIHNASDVIIRDMQGVFICHAKWNGNTRDAFAKPFVDKVKDERREHRRKLALSKLAEIEAEHKSYTVDQPDFSSLFDVTSEDVTSEIGSEDDASVNAPEPIFLFESERDDYQAKKKVIN